MFATFTSQYANMSSKHSHVYFLACRLYENIRLKEVKCFSTKFIDTMFGGGMDWDPFSTRWIHITSLPDSGGSGVQNPSCKMILPAICLGSTARPEREVLALLLFFLTADSTSRISFGLDIMTNGHTIVRMLLELYTVEYLYIYNTKIQYIHIQYECFGLKSPHLLLNYSS